MENPLRLVEQEQFAAWEAIDRMRNTSQFEEIEASYRSVLNHIGKLWIKAERSCTHFGETFRSWQMPYRELRETDPLLNYFRHARNADNHTVQDISYLVTGHLHIHGERLGFSLLESPVPSIGRVIDRGVMFEVPLTHLGRKLGTKDPREVCIHVYTFYADYLKDLRGQFFAVAS